MNRTILLLTISDILFLSGFGLVQPVMAIFIKEGLSDGTILAAGMASFLFWMVKSAIQVPFSKFVDAHDHQTVKRFLIYGTFFVALTPFLYILSKNVYGIYFADVVYALGAGLAYPSWVGLWSTHMDKHKESFQWSLYSTLVGVGTAVAGATGATLAQFLGFRATFLIVGVLSLVGCAALFGLERREDHVKVEERQYHERRKTSAREHGADIIP